MQVHGAADSEGEHRHGGPSLPRLHVTQSVDFARDCPRDAHEEGNPAQGPRAVSSQAGQTEAGHHLRPDHSDHKCAGQKALPPFIASDRVQGT